MANKLDIFQVLGKISSKDLQYYESLSEEDKKAIQPFVLHRWVSGTTNELQMIMAAEVSKYMFMPTRHKQLLFALLQVASQSRGRVSWPKPQQKHVSKPLSVSAVKQYYNYNDSQAVDAVDMLSGESIIEIAQDLGWQPTDVTALKKELKL